MGKAKLLWLVAVALTCGPCWSQTTGAPGANDLVIEGNGSSMTSCVATQNVAGTELEVLVDTQPSSPLIFATAASCFPGFIFLSPGRWIDLDGFTLQILFDATGVLQHATPLTLLFNSGPSGVFTLDVTSQETRDVSFGIQVASVNAAFMGGFLPTQAHELSIDAADLCPATIGGDLPLSEDGAVAVVLSSPFSFYGTSHTQVFVNMNGHLTFGGGDPDTTPTEAEMLAGPPRIAPAWDDWSPQDPVQGTVRVFDSGALLEVEWHDVRHFGICSSPFVDSNTFCAALDLASGIIELRYAGMLLCRNGGSPSTDQVAGISPGGGGSPANDVDLTGGHAGDPGEAIYEDFGQALNGDFDLEHLTTIGGQALVFTPAAGAYTLTVQ